MAGSTEQNLKLDTMEEKEGKSFGGVRLSQILGLIQTSRELLLAIVITIAILTLSLTLPNFLTMTNFSAVLTGMSLSTIIVIGMTVVMVAGMIDLSVGSVLACTGYAVAITLRNGSPIWFSILIGIAVSLLWGGFTGFLHSKIKVNFLIASLATMFMARGMVYILSQGRVVSGLPESFLPLGQGTVLGLSNLVWIAITGVIIADFLLHEIVSVRQLYRVGGSEETCRLMGINVDRIKWSAFIASGLLAGFAGILSVSRFGAAIALMGQGEELQAITACVIGGCTLRGGKGSAVGSLLGLFLLALIKDALVLMHISVFWQRFISGALLALVVSIDVMVHREQE